MILWIAITSLFCGNRLKFCWPQYDLFYSLVDESRQTTSKLRLSDIFLRPDIAQNKDNYDSLVRGMLTQHAQGQDQFFTREVFKSRSRCYKIL